MGTLIAVSCAGPYNDGTGSLCSILGLLYGEDHLYSQVTKRTMHDSQMQWGGVFALWVEAVDADVRAAAQHLHHIYVAGIGRCMQRRVAGV